MAKKETGSSGKSKALSLVEKALAKIASDAVEAPRIPVDRLVGEAKALAKVADANLDALLKVGLDRALVTSLESRADALSEAQARLVSARGASRDDAEIALEEEGTKLRSDMVADLRFAARANRDVQRQLDAVQEGDGVDDLVQDLRDLQQIFSGHGKELKKASVDAKDKSASAKRIASALERRVSGRRAGSASDGRDKELRDRAATYLEHAIAEIRAAGVYAFRGKPALQTKFRSPYEAAHRVRAKKPATPSDASASPDPA